MAVNCSTGFRAAILGPTAFESIFNGGCIEVYSGAQPAHADMAPTGVLLGRITSGGAWSEGSSTNGLLYQRTGHRVTNSAAQLWALLGVASGTAGWFRMRAISDPGADSLTARRIDGAIGALDAPGDFQLRLRNLTLAPSSSAPITSWWFALPPLD